MTPNELYKMESLRTETDIAPLFGCYFNHMPEIVDDYWRIAATEVKNERLEIRYYKDHSYDGRRIWRLASVWFDNKPFMVIQNAGREGDDHAARFITDVGLYKQAATYVKSIVPPDFKELPDVVSADEDVPTLTEFYGDSLQAMSLHY